MNILYSRRDFLAGMAAASASIIFPSGRSFGQSSAPRAGRVDVHHHFGSPAFVSMVNTKKSQGYQIWQPYTPARAIEDMDRGGISTAMISITTPGIWFGNIDETRRLARQENEYGARMVSDHKGRFGLFAVLPLPDVDASLREIEYAFDTLKAEGVGLLSNWGNKWLADESFKPVLD
jgi:predicted TIM-barrel fold metal-dependent hydrolase